MSEGPARWRAWAPYVVAGALAIVLVTVTATRADEPSAAEDVLGEKQLKIMAPADPGGGWDQTSRAMQAAFEDLVGRSEVYNVGGAGGTIGLSQFAQLEGQQNQLMTMGLVMVGAIAANEPDVTLDDVTPLARLITDNQVIVVPEDSEIETVDDLTKAMEDDLEGVSIAGGSAGGVEQILAGLLAQELGLDPADVNYIAHAGGGEAIATLLSGSATMGVSGISEVKPQIDAGALRPIAVTSAERVDILPDVPTLKEEGVDVVVTQLARRRRAPGDHRRAGEGARGPRHGDDRDRLLAGGASSGRAGATSPWPGPSSRSTSTRSRSGSTRSSPTSVSGRSHERARRPATTGTSRSTSAASWSATRRPSSSTIETDRRTALATMVLGALLLVLAVVVLVQAARLDNRGETVGAGHRRPGWSGPCCSSSPSLLIIRGRRDMGVWEVSEHTTSQDWLRMLTLLGVLIGYAIVMPFLGYVVSATLLFGATAVVLGAPARLRSFAYGWCVAVLVYLVFDVGIGISLPSGPWGF